MQELTNSEYFINYKYHIMAIIQLLRPYQWSKNLFIFLPLFFHGSLINLGYILDSTIAFLSFSLIASAIYCFNDIYDIKDDQQHPIKCNRPIASGKISIKLAYFIILLLIAIGISLLLFFGYNIKYQLSILILYISINIAYTLYLKRIALIDIFIISTGFVLRIILGGISTDIILSHWIILMTFLLALFLALAKRRDDVLIYKRTGIKARKNIAKYNLDFINQILTIIATITIVCYIMYTVSDDVINRLDSHNLYITSFFVLAGIIRYLQLTIVYEKSGNPTHLLITDRFLQFIILGWLLVFYIIIYM